MAQVQENRDPEPSGLVDALRDIQNQYDMLADIRKKEKLWTLRLTEIVKEFQGEAGEVIPLRPETIGENCQAAYLVSDAVVVTFDSRRHMTSKPFRDLPAGAALPVIEDIIRALGRMIAEKRRTGAERVESLEKVLLELKKAQGTMRDSPTDSGATEASAVETKPKASEPRGDPGKEEGGADSGDRHIESRDMFSFKGTFGDKKELEQIP